MENPVKGHSVGTNLSLIWINSYNFCVEILSHEVTYARSFATWFSILGTC